ncbi:glycosyltransferase [Microbacterium sp. CFBP9034]|uniref:glycosyltransferase n=1 Tax=Microbacterium sp. CFBP9034 TaxID=3096540 RepID=UPI002A698B5E|nr:glycosyltransferase [Microbacterium sp. CFBP9034]MDY0910431.1 glycosyltransferase [Microbacterium sp. CFBP9034]
MTTFPDAEYLILSSRLIPDHDGGYGLAILARARQMAAAGVHEGRGPLLLTFDPGTPADHARHRRAFDERALIVDPERMRNLFDEASDPAGGAAAWLRDAAHPGEPDAALAYRRIDDEAGRPVVGLPVIHGDPDWHITTAPVAVYGADGRVAGVVAGFGALYRAWLENVVRQLRAGGSDKPVVVICESRQLGELIAGWSDPGVRLIHSIHTIHLEPPHTPDAPLNPLWTRWFSLAERFDAVLWLSEAQRADVIERFGDEGVHLVIPAGVPAASSVVPGSERAPGRVVMLNRLAPGKRVDHAVRAFRAVLEQVPHATLDIYGGGVEHDRLQELIDELGLGAHVVLRGITDDPSGVLDQASAFLTTSAFEGQALAIVEAMVHGCPVVAYDVPYGPRDHLAGGGGVLVPDGDEDALAAAIVRVIADPEEHARLAREAAQMTRRVDPERVTAALVQAVEDVLAAPSRRV